MKKYEITNVIDNPQHTIRGLFTHGSPVALLAPVLALALSGCDNVGDTANDGFDTAEQRTDAAFLEQEQRSLLTGYFVDSPVGNINYRTQGHPVYPPHSGVTGADGAFRYRDGEQITFSIGDIELPTSLVPPSGTITPLDLVGTNQNYDPAVLNIVKFLLALDEDGNPDNGLNIPEQAKAAASGMSLDFSSGTFDTDISSYLAAAGGGGTLVAAKDAQRHLEQLPGIEPSDRDNDGTSDVDDAFPDDDSEQVDSDGDGVGDKADDYPNDPNLQSECQVDPNSSPDCSLPEAEAGAGQTVVTMTEVNLDGTGSSDPNGLSLTYSWAIDANTLPAGSVATLANANTATPILQNTAVPGVYTLELTVTNSDGYSDTDTVAIIVKKSMPTSGMFFGPPLLALWFAVTCKRKKKSKANLAGARVEGK